MPCYNKTNKLLKSRKMVNMNNLERINYIYELNQKYMANNFNGIYTADINYKIIDGKLPVLLSAPHAVKSFKEGKIKAPDALTGAIVELLCNETGAKGITRTCNLNDEPNSENTGHSLEYKKAILGLADKNNTICMLDIHGCAGDNPFDIDIGTNDGLNINGKSYFLDIIYKNLLPLGNIVIDNKFKASLDTNISNYISNESNLSCFQIEINANLRRNPQKLLHLIDCLEKTIKQLTRQIEHDYEK